LLRETTIPCSVLIGDPVLADPFFFSEIVECMQKLFVLRTSDLKCFLLLFLVEGFCCCVLCLQWIGEENEREEGETGRGIETANVIVGTGREKETEIGIGTETGDVSRDLVLGLR
jgi:hypothetical protein